MKSLKNIALLAAVSCILLACGTTTTKAPVEDRNQQGAKDQNPAATSAPVTGTRQDESATQYVVKKATPYIELR